jgi:hypothetical protein
MPDGQITLYWLYRFERLVQPFLKKYSAFQNKQITVDVDGAYTKALIGGRAKTCGPDASTPASSLQISQATVATKPDRPGEHV